MKKTFIFHQVLVVQVVKMGWSLVIKICKVVITARFWAFSLQWFGKQSINGGGVVVDTWPESCASSQANGVWTCHSTNTINTKPLIKFLSIWVSYILCFHILTTFSVRLSLVHKWFTWVLSWQFITFS